MAFRTIFGLEGNPLEFVQFEGPNSYDCSLCNISTQEGFSIVYPEKKVLAFCHSCFGFLQEGFDSIKERQLAAHARENEEVGT